MNDYKELVDKLRFYADTADGPIYGICTNSPKVMFQAADAIEQLVKDRNVLQLQNHLERCEHEHTRKERDAAVADMKRIRKEHDGCVACRYGDTINHHCHVIDYDCKNCKIDECMCKRCRDESNWEWRGVREDNDGNA